MKILFLSTWFPYPPDNGSKLRVLHLLRSLSVRHEVTLVAFAFGTAQLDRVGDLDELCVGVETVNMNPITGNRASTLRTFVSLKPPTSRPVQAMRDTVRKLTENHSYDVVIASPDVMAGYALELPVQTTKLLEQHNSLTRWMWERYTAQSTVHKRARCWISWQKARRFEADLFGKFDLVTMVSQQDRNASLADLPGYSGRVEVVPNGVDTHHNQPGMCTTRPDQLVFNGSLTYDANFDAMKFFLDDIYPQVRREIPKATLTITGSTTGVDLSGMKLDESVTLTGFVEDVRVPVASASVCVAPIRQGGGTRLKILEAMALGTPVVATHKGAEGLEVTDGDHLLLADDRYSFARRTIQLMSDPGLQKYLAANARRLVEEKYDWARIGETYVTLMEETVRTHRRIAHKQ